MKKITLTILFLLAINYSFAFTGTKYKFGIFGGISFSNFIGSDLIRDSEFRKSYVFGSFLRINPHNKLIFQPEVMYSKKGQIDDHVAGEHYRIEFELDYLDFNILSGFNISDNLTFLIGPYFGVYLKGTQSIKVNDYEKHKFEIPNDYLPKYDYGIMSGTSLYFFKYFSFEFRYFYGLKGLYRNYANYGGIDPEPGIKYEKYLNIRNSSWIIILGLNL